jgi:hypothetical protein
MAGASSPVLKTALPDHLFNRQKINNPPNRPPTFALMYAISADGFRQVPDFMVRPA